MVFRQHIDSDVALKFKLSSSFDATPHNVVFNSTTQSVIVVLTGLKIRNAAVLEVEGCHYMNSSQLCPFQHLNQTFATVNVVHSRTLSVAVVVVGWLYFVAWSISFYPQIFLNCKRKSVVGLSFDFLLLNVIGFACYTLYNVLMYFDEEVKDIYRELHPRSPPPVLLNDVIFAAHAFGACLVTALQCFFYEKGKQRVSYTCMGISSIFVVFAAVSLALTIFQMIDSLEFIMFLSYIKMAVTLSKYFPQAFFNFRRKSTMGWSIGNVLLDLTGGCMDICQMILQAINTDDWSAFSGNPVKFGLGLVSIIFDFVFITQHYILYRNSSLQSTNSYDNIGTESAAGSSNLSDEVEYGIIIHIYFFIMLPSS
uniref:Cystinosin homolog n=1 Tax=Syphacia muris TaxID=451379 RepID=A0A0N5AQH2_9BILA